MIQNISTILITDQITCSRLTQYIHKYNNITKCAVSKFCFPFVYQQYYIHGSVAGHYPHTVVVSHSHYSFYRLNANKTNLKRQIRRIQLPPRTQGPHVRPHLINSIDTPPVIHYVANTIASTALLLYKPAYYSQYSCSSHYHNIGAPFNLGDFDC